VKFHIRGFQASALALPGRTLPKGRPILGRPFINLVACSLPIGLAFLRNRLPRNGSL
jgi:hypothetical protein